MRCCNFFSKYSFYCFFVFLIFFFGLNMEFTRVIYINLDTVFKM